MTEDRSDHSPETPHGRVGCPYCEEHVACKNDLLQHVLLNHDGDMRRWPA